MNRNQFIVFALVGSAICIFCVYFSPKRVPAPPEQVASAPVLNMSAEFDIEHINVFSVERRTDGSTLICYHTNGDDVEFSIHTTDAQHESFVKRFKSKLGVQ